MYFFIRIKSRTEYEKNEVINVYATGRNKS